MQIFNNNNKKKPAANLNNSPNEEFCSSVKKKIFFLQNTNILMHAYHLILIKPFPILQTLVSCNTGDFICKHKSPSSNTCCYCQLFQWNDQKWKKKNPQNYTVVAWGWDGGGLLVLTGGNCLPLYRWMVLTRGPGHGYLKMDWPETRI